MNGVPSVPPMADRRRTLTNWSKARPKLKPGTTPYEAPGSGSYVLRIWDRVAPRGTAAAAAAEPR